MDNRFAYHANTHDAYGQDPASYGPEQSAPWTTPQPRRLDHVRQALRRQRYSIHTEEA
ncbi:MAG: hypothetical protein MI924_38230 [Chloroflexales bacterium]|nr:hypothetical protein [Chloroflexales bacterium]